MPLWQNKNHLPRQLPIGKLLLYVLMWWIQWRRETMFHAEVARSVMEVVVLKGPVRNRICHMQDTIFSVCFPGPRRPKYMPVACFSVICVSSPIISGLTICHLFYSTTNCVLCAWCRCGLPVWVWILSTYYQVFSCCLWMKFPHNLVFLQASVLHSRLCWQHLSHVYLCSPAFHNMLSLHAGSS